jgi:hypothetical protein
MFLVKPRTEESIAQAVFMLSFYHVKFHTQSNGEDIKSLIIIVDDETQEGALLLAEMAFQMNFHQANERLCEVCKGKIEKTGVGFGNCGHLTFSRLI